MDQPGTPHNVIYTVSKLTAGIKALLEDRFPFVWVTGEVSNFSMPSSGHFYFTLKDEESQINAVMFRGQSRNLKFSPTDGMNITGLGRISVYPPRGSYQIIFEFLEPKGVGEMQVAFEQLKKRLMDEGLFDEKHKKKLPFLPQKISVITSPTGAVIHDIIRIAQRRFPNLHIQIIPTKVQGEGAEKEIVEALKLLDQQENIDLAILARGGGSLEDLNAFNAEIVAKAIFSSRIPIVSAIGHETDFTIADFVADLRAPTPSAAAEISIPQKYELKRKLQDAKNDLIKYAYNEIEAYRNRILQLKDRLVDPRKRIQDLRLKIDDTLFRLARIATNSISQKRQICGWWQERLLINHPGNKTKKLKEDIDRLISNLLYFIKITLYKKADKVKTLTARLNALNPRAVLGRGYSITRIIPNQSIVRSAASVDIGQDLDILLARGSLVCRVERKTVHGQEDI